MSSLIEKYNYLNFRYNEEIILCELLNGTISKELFIIEWKKMHKNQEFEFLSKMETRNRIIEIIERRKNNINDIHLRTNLNFWRNDINNEEFEERINDINETEKNTKLMEKWINENYNILI